VFPQKQINGQKVCFVTFVLFVVSWLSGDSVGAREPSVGFILLYGKEETGKEVAFSGMLSTNHVV
jgi:hypothetical protein